MFSLCFYVVMLMFILQSCSCSMYLYTGSIHGAHKLHYSLYVSQSFDEDEVKIIEEAAKEWEDKTDHIVSYDIFYNWDDRYDSMPRSHSVALVKVNSAWSSRYLDKQDKNSNVSRILGLYDAKQKRPTIYIVVDRALGRAFLKATFEHELGHSLSLDHDKSIDAVMYYSTELGSLSITTNDLKQFCKIHHCRTAELINHQ